MSFWTPANLAAVTAGRWLGQPADPSAPVCGVSIDSRTVSAGQVFVAVKGERFDGHDYVSAAFERGAAIAIVSDDHLSPLPGGEGGASLPTGGVLLVDDTVAALQALAGVWRDVLRRAGVKVIAVTGSNGKTTTRHLIHTVLSAGYRGTQSPKSFNNHLGVPLTLLAASVDDDFVVVEVGTNHPGEIAALARIVQPDAAVITNIGSAHVGHFDQFGGLQAIAIEKASLLRFLEPNGLAVVPAEMELLDAGAQFLPTLQEVIPANAGISVCRFGDGEECEVRLTKWHERRRSAAWRNEPMRFTVNGSSRFALPMLGLHNIFNALAAIAVGRWMGLGDDQMAGALQSVADVPMRLQAGRLGRAKRSITLINDAYNANPDSVVVAARTLANLAFPKGGRRVFILGDMLELGDDAAQRHRDTGRAIGQFDPSLHWGWDEAIHLVICIGELSAHAAEALRVIWPHKHVQAFAQWSDDLPEQIAALLRPGDVVLIKGSRGMKLERLVPAIEKAFTHDPVAAIQ